MSLADKNARELVTLSQIIFDAFTRSSTFISRRAQRAVVRSLFIRLDHRCFEKEAPPACAVTNLRSRTGAKGGVNRGCKRLTVETVLHTCNRQAATPRWKFRVGRIQVGIEHCRRRQSDFVFFTYVLTINRAAAIHSTHCQHGRI